MRKTQQIVQLLVTCMIDAIAPNIGMSVKNILNRHQCEVQFQNSQTCCGQPAFNAGFIKQARTMARHTIDVFSKTTGPVVIPSGSCTDMIVHQYPEILKHDPIYKTKAEQLSKRTFEFTQFLVDYLKVEDVGAHYTGCAAYHPCCHGLRNLNIDRQPSILLNNTQSLKQVELDCAEECCGFGGLFSINMNKISESMLNKKMSHVIDSGANVLIANDLGCIIHMQGGLRRKGINIKVKHIAEIIDDCN